MVSITIIAALQAGADDAVTANGQGAVGQAIIGLHIIAIIASFTGL